MRNLCRLVVAISGLDCINVNVLFVILCSHFSRCYYWKKSGKKNALDLSALFLTSPCEAANISQQSLIYKYDLLINILKLILFAYALSLQMSRVIYGCNYVIMYMAVNVLQMFCFH